MSLPPRKSQRIQNNIQEADKFTKFDPSPENHDRLVKKSYTSYSRDLNLEQNLSMSLPLAFGASDKASRFSKLFRHKTIIA